MLCRILVIFGSYCLTCNYCFVTYIHIVFWILTLIWSFLYRKNWEDVNLKMWRIGVCVPVGVRCPVSSQPTTLSQPSVPTDDIGTSGWTTSRKPKGWHSPLAALYISTSLSGAAGEGPPCAFTPTKKELEDILIKLWAFSFILRNYRHPYTVCLFLQIIYIKKKKERWIFKEILSGELGALGNIFYEAKKDFFNIEQIRRGISEVN